MKVVIDTETNALKNYTKLWLIVCREVETDKVHVFRRPDLQPQPFLQFSQTITGLIGHNLVGFDWLVLKHFGLDLYLDQNRCIDTLILSRLTNYLQEGGHSLENWGNILDIPKGSYDNFEELKEEMVDYCIQDTLVTLKVYHELERFIEDPRFLEAIPMEHRLQFLCNDLTSNGFPFAVEEAWELRESLKTLRDQLTEQIQRDFPPKPRFLREITPKRTLQGYLSTVPFGFLKKALKPQEVLDLEPYEEGCPFTLMEWQPFNPASSKMAVEVLNQAGWKPFNRTTAHNEFMRLDPRERDPQKHAYFKTYGWKVDEDNLATLPDSAPPGAKLLLRWRMISKRIQTLEEWLDAYEPETCSIHGSFSGIGSWTQRMAHKEPNMANAPSVAPRIADKAIAKEAGDYGRRMRELWTVSDPDNLLVGVDADAIQMRVFAHLINSPDLIKALVEGKKEEGTDIHTVHQRALGQVCRDRDQAKTFIYAFLLGAQDGKVAEIFGCSTAQAAEARSNFLAFYPGLREITEGRIPRDAARGFFQGLDGRLVVATGATYKDKARTMLAGYLQNGEAVVMKTACCLWHERLEHCRNNWWFRNFVHDEWQTEVKGSLDFAEYIASVQMEAIRDVGQHLQLNLPLLGSRKIGKNWMQTH